MIASAALTTVVAVPAMAAVSTPVVISGASPFTAGCTGRPDVGTIYPDTEVEPHLSINPADPSNIVAAWQQDRASNGGSRGLVNAVSTDGGDTWAHSYPLFSRCALTLAEVSLTDPSQPGRLWDRATDPWVSFGPTGGVVHQISDSFNVTGRGFGDGSAILYARSTDGGKTWSTPKVLREDLNNTTLNDKETITADPDGTHVYAIWDRLESPPSNGRANPISAEHAIGYRGPTWFTRSSDGGTTWDSAKIIYDPGTLNQTIGSQIVVDGAGGALYNGFNLIQNVSNKNKIRGYNVAIQQSPNQGTSWGAPTVVSSLVPSSVTTPGDGLPVRTGDIIPDIAIGPHRTSGPAPLYFVWQDARFTGNGASAIAFAKSTDGGKTWSAPTRVDTAGTAQAFNAAVDVDDNGRIAVVYYAFDAVQPDPAKALARVWVRTSTDGGSNWTNAEAVTGSFDVKKAPIARGYFLGDYIGLTHAGTTFYVDPAITTNSTSTNSDIVLAKIS